jgi:hypothetical protein
VKRTAVLFFYQIIGEHELGDPRQNATHQPQLQDFGIAEVVGKFPVQYRIQCALRLGEGELFSQCEHRFLGIGEGAVLRVIKRVNLFFS